MNTKRKWECAAGAAATVAVETLFIPREIVDYDERAAASAGIEIEN